ncbi:MAG TPA: TetR/AcrR family transcriptional regulator [Myxococcales bacterium]|nr:TetR/AcrR family transcriptional regulator [Myxococcales bacterium]
MSRASSGSVTGTRKEGTSRLPRDQRRQSILDGATRAFAQAGFSATRMAEIARASGVTPIIVYRHFGSKEELYRAALGRVCRRLSVELEAGQEPGGFGVGAESVLAAARHDADGCRFLWRHAVVGYLVEAVLNWLEYGDPKRDALFVKATNAAMRADAGSKPTPKKLIPWGRCAGRRHGVAVGRAQSAAGSG